MVQREPRVQSIKREKNSDLGDISPKIRFFWKCEREREREKERERGRERERERGGGGKNPSAISRVSSVGSH